MKQQIDYLIERRKELEKELGYLQDDLNSFDDVKNPTNSEEQLIYELLIDIEELEKQIYTIHEECDRIIKESQNKENQNVKITMIDYRFQIEDLLEKSENRLNQILDNHMNEDKYLNEEDWIRDFEFVNGRVCSYRKVLEILNYQN